jgi:hypothetical protein
MQGSTRLCSGLMMIASLQDLRCSQVPSHKECLWNLICGPDRVWLENSNICRAVSLVTSDCDHRSWIRPSLRDRDAQQKNRNIVENVGGTTGVELLCLDVSMPLADLQMQCKSVWVWTRSRRQPPWRTNIPFLLPRFASTLFERRSHDTKLQAPIHHASQCRISDVEINV